jgi:hypothetical protein
MFYKKTHFLGDERLEQVGGAARCSRTPAAVLLSHISRRRRRSTGARLEQGADQTVVELGK